MAAERGRQLRRPPYSKCAFFFYGTSAAFFGPIFVLSWPSREPGPIRVSEHWGELSCRWRLQGAAEEYSFETPILTLQLQGTIALNIGHRGALKVQKGGRYPQIQNRPLWAHSPNGLLYSGRLLRLNSQVPRRVGTITWQDGPSTLPPLGPFLLGQWGKSGAMAGIQPLAPYSGVAGWHLPELRDHWSRRDLGVHVGIRQR